MRQNNIDSLKQLENLVKALRLTELQLYDNSKLAQRVFSAQKMKLSIKDLFSKYDQIHKKLRIRS